MADGSPTDQIDEARRVSFDARAKLYDAVRPSYPDALADDVLARGGGGRGSRVLEIGAGTGKATVVFARRGRGAVSVVALEPGASLAAVLRRNVAGLDVTVVETTFEAWPAPAPGDRGFDVVMAAQAIHWIDPRVRYAKAAAVLAPGGVLAVVRNEKRPLVAALRDELDAAYARWHVGASNRPIQDDVDVARREIGGEIDASGLFEPVETRLYPWTETYTTARYLDLLDTYSDHAVLAPECRAPLYAAIAAAIERHGGGAIEIPYVSLAFTAPRRL